MSGLSAFRYFLSESHTSTKASNDQVIKQELDGEDKSHLNLLTIIRLHKYNDKQAYSKIQYLKIDQAEYSPPTFHVIINSFYII